MTLPPAPTDRRTALFNTLPSVVLMALGIGIVLILLFTAAGRQDRYAAEGSERLMTSLLAHERSLLERVASDAAREPLLHNGLAGAFERQWAEQHLGQHFAHQFGLQAVMVFSPEGQPVYLMRDGNPDLPVHVEQVLGSHGQVLYERLLAQSLIRSSDGKSQWSTGTPAVFSYLRWEGELALALATRLASPQPRPYAQQAVLVLVRRLGSGALAEMARHFGLPELRFVLDPQTDREERGGTQPHLTLNAVDGAPVGTLFWQVPRPGEQLLDDTVLPVTAALVLMVVLGGWAAYHSHRTASALRRSSGQLADSEARFRAFAETASDWLWESGPEHDYTFVSERLGDLLGRAAAGALGTTLAETAALAHEDGPGLLRALEQRRPFRDLRCTVTAADGTVRTLHIAGQPVLTANGRFLGYRGTGVDVTAHQSAIHDAERTRDLLSDAVESISEGFVLFDADSRLVICNSRYRAAYPLLADCLVPGVTFTDVLRTAALRGGYQEAMSDLASWVAERLSRHVNATQSTDHRLGDNRWYRISERSTRSGGVVKILTDITELKSHEEALARKTALLQATFDNIAQGICVTDNENRLVAWNANFLAALDYPEALAQVGEPLAPHFGHSVARNSLLVEEFPAESAHGDGTGPVGTAEAGMGAAVGETGRMAGELLLPDGRVVEARQGAMPGGGTVTTYTDITERKRFERVLTELSQTVVRQRGSTFFHALAASLCRALGVDGAFIAMLTEDGDMIETMGMTVDGQTLPNRSFALRDLPAGLLPAADALFIPAGVAATLPSASPLAVWQPDSYLSRALFDSSNVPMGLIAVFSRGAVARPAMARALLNIFSVRAAAELERLQTETALRESEHRYRQLVELAPYGIVIWDGRRILFTNEAAARILGSPTAAHLVGSDLVARFQPFADPAFLERLRSPLESSWDDKPCETRLQSDDGTILDVEVSLFLFAHEGQSVSLVMFHDITHRKRAEAALQHAHKMQAVGELAGGIAHEFNNMLTAISGFAHMARRSPADVGRVEACVTEIIKASDRAASLTGQLLSFSRRGLSENIQRIAVPTLLGDLERFLRPILGKSVEITFEDQTVDQDVEVEADPGLLHQALVNLVLNGRDAMPDGGRLTVRASVMRPSPVLREKYLDLKDIRYVALAVTDTGSGIPKEVLERIFEPFFTTKEQGKGTGLGLSLVYNTVTRVGGIVAVESLPGQGATFTLYLPALALALATAAPVEPLPASDERSEKATILVVEDEDQVRAFLRLTLEDLGLTVVTAENGLEALCLIREHDPPLDLLLTDLVMPKISGTAVAKAMQEEYPDAPILFMSGYAPENLARELPEEVAEDHLLTKPIDPRHLAQVVRRLLVPPEEMR